MAPPAPVSALTLKDVVSRITSLPGVAGAVLASQDGMLMGAKFPPEYKPDVIAALIPQITSKLDQFTKELNLSEVSQAGFLAGSVPWHICQAGGVLLIVMGRSGENLPMAQLKLVAEALKRYNVK
jgi:predicted regulator of Ras-like GTPase activity (Roadblock/LC7/MglB family)